MDHGTLISEMDKVEKLSTQERLRLAKKRRQLQLKRWSLRENKKDWKPLGSNTRSVHFTPSVTLLESSARNDISEVRRILSSGVNPNSTNDDGLTALHQCCIDDSQEMMELLLEYGANVNAVDTEKWTPLHAAATCGHLHLVQFLIENGADLLVVNGDGNMPYDLCEDDTTLSYIENEMAKRGVTQNLIDETRSFTERNMLKDLRVSRDLELRDSSGATFLHIAAANGFNSVVEYLLDHDVAVDLEDDDLWQPIHAAACWGHCEVLEMLAISGADFNAKNRNGETPIDICEDGDIKDRLIQLRDQRLKSEIPKVKRSRSVSTRTQSIRRTSLREKMNTTKRDVIDEKLYLFQNLEQDTGSGSIGTSDKVVDINDVELILSDETDYPKRPPRLNKEPLTDSTESNPSLNIHVSVTINAPYSPSTGTTLADLKKQRSLSRLKNSDILESGSDSPSNVLKNNNELSPSTSKKDLPQLRRNNLNGSTRDKSIDLTRPMSITSKKLSSNCCCIL